MIIEPIRMFRFENKDGVVVCPEHELEPGEDLSCLDLASLEEHKREYRHYLKDGYAEYVPFYIQVAEGVFIWDFQANGFAALERPLEINLDFRFIRAESGSGSEASLFFWVYFTSGDDFFSAPLIFERRAMRWRFDSVSHGGENCARCGSPDLNGCPMLSLPQVRKRVFEFLFSDSRFLDAIKALVPEAIRVRMALKGLFHPESRAFF